MKMFSIKSILFFIILGFIGITGYSQIQSSKEELENRISKGDSLWALSQYDKAIIIYENVLDKAPKTVKVYEKLVKAYAYLGMFEMAEERAVQLYNGGIGENCRLGLIYTMQNRTEDALKAVADMMKSAEPGQYFPGAPTCAMYFETPAGEYKKAADKIYKIIEQAPELGKLKFMLYAIYLERQLGNHEKSNMLLKQLEAEVNKLRNNGILEEALQSPTGFWVYRSLAEYYTLKGKDEMAIDLLQKYYERGGRQYYWIKCVSPFFKQYEDTPQFVTLMKNMKTKIDEMRQNVEEEL